MKPRTVSDVLAMPAVQAGAPEVLSTRGLTRPVRWVHVSDLADLSDLLRGGELVLTTGVPLQQSPTTYLEGLAAAGAAGVVVESGSRLKSLPARALRAAEACDLPVILLHKQIRFVDVTEAVHRCIVADQYEEVEFARNAHETFTDLSMTRASLSDIVEAAAHMLHVSVVLEDLAHNALAVSAVDSPATELLRDWERRSRVHSGGGYDQGSDAEDWRATTVGPRGAEWGRLIVPHVPADESRTKMVLERAAQALALHRMAERDQFGLEHRAQSGLIEDVLRGRVVDDAEISARAAALSLRVSSSYLPAAVLVAGPSPGADPVAAQRRDLKLLDAVVHSVKAHGYSALFSIRRNGEIGIVLAPSGGRRKIDEGGLNVLGAAIASEVRRALGAHTTRFAVGVATDAVSDAVHGLAEAMHVAEVAMSMPGSDRAFHRASDVRLRGLLALLRTDPRVQSFAETELRALLKHDIRTGANLLDVLRGYLEAGGNKSKLADRLNLSRPALYSRLATIEEVLNVDLEAGESRTSLHAALLILDAQRFSGSATAGASPAPRI